MPRVPILLYHRIGRPQAGARVPGQCVSPRLFRKHLSYLRARGYESVSLLDVVSADRPLPPRPVAITFDDGYRSLHEAALPALVEHRFPATVFLVAGAIGGANLWEQAAGDVAEPLLDPAQIREMSGAGIEFGSHTLTHPHLTALPAPDAQREIAGSRKRIEDLLGSPCQTFAYPYGDWNAEVRELVSEAGYRAACTTRRAAARRGDDPLSLPRINIRRYNIIPRFAYKLWRAERARP